VPKSVVTDKAGTTLIVGASDCKNQKRADYKPDGTADQTEINNAINALPT